MQTSETGIAFIKSWEGYSATPYDDNGHLCFGYGHDQVGSEPVPESISQDEADLLLRRDLATRFESAVSALVSPLCNQNQFDACVDFAYNLGVQSLRVMLSHGWEQVPEQILRWNHVSGVVNAGLTSRRQAEVQLFNS